MSKIENFKKIRNLRRKWFLGIYILISIFSVAWNQFFETWIFQEPFLKMFHTFAHLSFWLNIDSSLKVNFMKKIQVRRLELVNNIALRYVFSSFTGQKCSKIKNNSIIWKNALFYPLSKSFRKNQKHSIFNKFLRKYT